MALSAGLRLGPYEIVAPLGAGGMGEVYRARDTRLDRTVAIKVLPAALSGDPHLRERFDREARAISSLNHPHICTLYDVGHESGIDFLVLEHLEGQTLADRLTALQGQGLPVGEAVAIAIQIADALDRAHRSGIVHRDLKPANVMLTKSGPGSTGSAQAKLLDFGLAKSATPVVSAGSGSMLPTTPAALTAQGAILGTFQYMAPEQIEGFEADARTDIFAFGALLFEMVTGRRAFEGKTRAQLLGAILKDEPPSVSTLQPLVPGTLDRIVTTCLAKDPDDRWQTARDLVRELKWALEPLEVSGLSSRESTGPRANRSPWLPWAVAAGLAAMLLGAAVVVVRHVRERPPAYDPVQFTIPAPENTQFGGPPAGGTGLQPQVALSPDGQTLVFVARGDAVAGTFMLWVRPIGSLSARLLPGTEGAAFPFWAPNSRFIGFFADGKLKKIAASGGPAQVLCNANGGRGGTWSRADVIVFARSGVDGAAAALERVSAAGGAPAPASVIDGEYGESSHRWPHFLPDGRHFLYTGTTGTCCPASKAGRIRVGSLDSSEVTTLLEADSSAVYASGYLLFNRINDGQGTLMAQSFDPGSRQLIGDAFPVVEQLAWEGSRYGTFSVSDTGALVYGRGVLRRITQLTWIDRAGKVLGTVGEPGRYLSVDLSPDNSRIAVALSTGAQENIDVWMLDVGRGAPKRLTFDPGVDGFPLWAPDGLRIAFQAYRGGDANLRQLFVNRPGEDELLMVERGLALTPTGWSPDGQLLLMSRAGLGTGFSDIWALPMAGDRKASVVLATTANDSGASLSPDGKWMAYESTGTGQGQVFVRPFPSGGGGTYQISTNGGHVPKWSADGKELFFLTRDGTMMTVAIDAARQFDGIPVPLFATGVGNDQNQPYAVARDGKRFLVAVPQTPSAPPTLTVVLNWLDTIQK